MGKFQLTYREQQKTEKYHEKHSGILDNSDIKARLDKLREEHKNRTIKKTDK